MPHADRGTGRFFVAWAGLASLLAGNCAYALDGSTALKITPLNIPGNDWRILELYTGGNTITSIADAGYTQRAGFDGIGAYTIDSSTLRVLVNHEASPASVSYLDLNTANLKSWLTSTSATPSGQVVKKIGQAYTSIVGSTSLSTFCSSTLFEANRFGTGRGFASRAYMTGEEVTNGSIYAIDLDPTSSTYRTMFDCTALPLGKWENVAEFDTGRSDKIGLVLLEDGGSNVTTGTSPMRIWIGNKRDVDNNGTLSFLEKNGLAEGTVYYWDPDGAATVAPTSFTSTGTTISGKWTTSPTNAMKFSKLEDGTVSPHDGSLIAFNCQDQGTFTMQLNTVFTGGSLDTTLSGATIKLLLEEALDGGAATGFNNQDNMTWSWSNLLFTQEDGDDRQIWQLDPTSTSSTRNALAIAQVLAGTAGESSGIVDISSLVGYMPGSVLLTNALSNSTLNQNQMVVMFSPTATVPEPSVGMLALAAAGAGLLRRGNRRK